MFTHIYSTHFCIGNELSCWMTMSLISLDEGFFIFFYFFYFFFFFFFFCKISFILSIRYRNKSLNHLERRQNCSSPKRTQNSFKLRQNVLVLLTSVAAFFLEISDQSFESRAATRFYTAHALGRAINTHAVMSRHTWHGARCLVGPCFR